MKKVILLFAAVMVCTTGCNNDDTNDEKGACFESAPAGSAIDGACYEDTKSECDVDDNTFLGGTCQEHGYTQNCYDDDPLYIGADEDCNEV